MSIGSSLRASGVMAEIWSGLSPLKNASPIIAEMQHTRIVSQGMLYDTVKDYQSLGLMSHMIRMRA